MLTGSLRLRETALRRLGASDGPTGEVRLGDAGTEETVRTAGRSEEEVRLGDGALAAAGARWRVRLYERHVVMRTMSKPALHVIRCT